ncbi:MAG: lytic transglycosylase domain-containing protein [Thermodesulfobacteriota bacterium]
MGRRILNFLFWSTPFQVLWLGSITISACVAVGLGLAVWLARIQEPLVGGSTGRQPSSPWGREIKLAQKAFQGTLAQEPWGLEEIRWYVAASFRNLTPAEKRDLVKAIYEASRDYGLAPQLIISVIMVESEGDATLESPKGAKGLMQVMPAVGQEVAAQVALPWREEETLFHPATNVRIGTHYLFQMLQRYRDLPLALCAYWLGPNRLDRLLFRNEVPPWHYAKRVLEVLEGL